MAGSEGGKYIEGLMGSAAWSIPEMFGITPPPYVQEFRQDNAFAGFGSAVLGSSVPIGGWFLATKKIKYLRELIEATGKAKALSNPVMVGALREGVRWTPFELSRLGANTAFGDESFGQMLSSNIMNMGIDMAVGGVGGFIRGSGDRVKTFAEKYPQYNAGQPYQMQIRTLTPEWTKMQPGPERDTMGRYLMDLSQEVRSQKSPDGRYASFFENESFDDYMKPSGKKQKLKREPQFKYQDALFDGEKGDTTGRNFISKKFIVYPGHFADETSVYNAIGEMGVQPGDFDKWAQFPRRISFKTDEAGELMKKFYDARYTPLGEGWYIQKEANDGLYVMGKRFPGKTPSEDQWNIFKTDSPDWFRKNNAQFLSAVAKENAWVQIGQQPITDIGPLGTAFNNLLEQLPYRHLMRTSFTPGRIAHTFDEVSNMLGLSGLKKSAADYEAVARVQRFIKQYLTPLEHQTKSSPRGTYVVNMARSVYEAAEAYTNKVFRGESQLKNNLVMEWITNAVKGDPAMHAGGLNRLIDDAGQAGINDLVNIWRDEPDMSAVLSAFQANKITQQTYDLAKALNENDFLTREDIKKIRMQFEGSTSEKPNMEPFLFPKKWEGEIGYPVYDQAGRLRAVALAETGAQSKLDLDTILAAHPDWRAGKAFNRSTKTPTAVKAAFNGTTPNVLGYKYNFTYPTIEEFKKATRGIHNARTQQQADLLQEHLLGQEMRHLNTEDPHMHALVSERLGDMRGQQRPWGKRQNEIADQLLAPIFGANSATKIVQATNEGLFQFQLGGFNLAFNAMNILTPIQTMLPHLMYVFNATNEIAHDMMRFVPVLRDLKPVASLGFVDGFKLINLSMKELVRPTDDTLRLMNRLVNDGYIEPQYVEEFMGEGATRAIDMRKAFSSAGNFVSWMRAVSNFGAANSEKFSRMTAAVMASQAARKVIGVMDENQELDIVKTLLRHTMYGYKQVDRAAIMTTPAGSAFGLFKNWMLQYMFWMGEYSKTAWNGGHLLESATKGYYKPLLWQQAATLGIGGLAASPLILAAEGINDLLSDDDLLKNVYESMNDGVADGLMFGIPALSQKAGFGFTLTSNASAPGANPIRDAQMLYTLAMWDRMNYIGKAAGAALDNWQATGEHPMFDQHVAQLFVRGLSPRWFYRSMQAIYDEGISSLNTGYPLMPREASVMERLMYSFGLTPLEIEKQARAADILYRDQQQKRALMSATARAFIEAADAGDYDQTSMIIRGAIINGLDIDNLMRSVAGRRKAANEDQLSRTFKPENAAEYRRLLGLEN